MSFTIETLFNKDQLETVKQRTLADIRQDIKDDNPIYGTEGTFGEKLFRKYRLPVATITSKISRVSSEKIEYVISFQGGNGRFFHYIPTKKADITKPRGYSISDAVYLYFDNNNDAAKLKEQIKVEDGALDAWYQLVKAEVEEFNKNLPGFIGEAIAENTARLQREKELEDELNG